MDTLSVMNPPNKGYYIETHKFYDNFYIDGRYFETYTTREIILEIKIMEKIRSGGG